MAKRRPADKTPRQRSAPSKPSRQERRQAARKDAKVQQTVETASPLTAALSYSRRDTLAFFVLGLLVVVPYLPAMLWGGFVWDDNTYIVEAEPVRELGGLLQIWFSPGDVDSHYWPLTYTTFWLEYKLWGFHPMGYHVVNVLLHLANTMLVWHLVRRLAVPGAWWIAAVFAVHPLHVESVAWVIERKDVLSGLFYLAAALTWMRSHNGLFLSRPRRRRGLNCADRNAGTAQFRPVWGWYAASLALYAAAMLSKSIAVTLPAALLICHWWKQGRVTSTDLFRLVPFFVVGLVIALGDLSSYRSVHKEFDFSLSFIERLLIASRALWFYVGKLLWPVELAVIYPRWDIGVADQGYLIAAVAVVMALWYFRQQLGRGPLAGALFFAVTLSPVLGFVDHAHMKWSFVAERFQYLAGIGVMAVVVGACTCGVRRWEGWWQKGALGLAATVLVVLGLLTWRQASIYQDEEIFYRHIIKLNPQAPGAHRNLGNTLYKQGRYEEALEAYRGAAKLYPNYTKVHANLGKVLNKLERFEEAEIHLRRAIALDPKTKRRYHHLGNALYGQGRYEEALAAARVAVEQDPNYFDAHVSLGSILSALGRFEEAETHLRRAIALNPNEATAYSNMGIVLFYLGRNDEALQRFDQALSLDPNTKTIRRLAHLRLEQQRYDEALKFFQLLIDIDPNDAATYSNMGIALYYLGRSAEALQRFDQALSLDPTLENARDNREAVLKAVE